MHTAGVLEAQSIPPIRFQETLPTTLVSQRGATGNSVVTLLDTSKNHAGVCSFVLHGGTLQRQLAWRTRSVLPPHSCSLSNTIDSCVRVNCQPCVRIADPKSWMFFSLAVCYMGEKKIQMLIFLLELRLSATWQVHRATWFLCDTESS